VRYQRRRRNGTGLVALCVFLLGESCTGSFAEASADSACDKDASLLGYKGSDAGRLIIAFGSNHGMDYAGYRLNYRAKSGCGKAFISHLHANFNIFTALLPQKQPDIDDAAEEAEVWVVPLAPGEYEFYDFEIWSDNGIVRNRFSPREEFSVPFTIKTGTSTYLGDFRAMALNGRNIVGFPVEGGAYFMISDQSDRDLKIAKAHDPAVTEVEKAVPDAKTLGSSYFRPMF